MLRMPMPEPLGIPAPAWLIQIIFELSNSLHIIFVSIVLGISIVLTAHLIVAPENEFFNSLNRRLARILFPATIFALATAFLPLLMYQTNFGHLVLTSDIMLGSFKLGLPLAAGALLISVAARNLWIPWLGTRPRRALVMALIVMSLALLKAALATNNAYLAQRPDLWSSVMDGVRFPIVPDMSFAPSFAITMLRSVAVCGVVIALIGYADNLNERATKYGLRLIIICSVFGSLAGWWYLNSLPSTAMILSTAWTATYLLALFLIGTSILGILRPRNPLWGGIAAGITGLMIFGIVIIGSSSRAALLKPYFNPLDLPVRTQTVSTILFFLCLTAALTAAAMIFYWIFNRS
jgi:type III secretory pathway component EscS